ncbi:Sepiapterin reductase [Holothuria leucospilota]|uniref:Sepiapterin reductase n=1 Tax=Holothuria leucospilota TaxID=206669 RepID=A0A9Q1BWB6_HOLLE|nr:Sepiapterin reductase [Holothuria leucospilota]
MNRKIFETVGDVSRFSHAIIIHNAASLGIISKYAREMNDVSSIQQFFLLNMTAPIVMTSSFLKCTNGCRNSSLRKTVVQITSLAGSRPQKLMHLYCAAKSGRDMFFRSMAVEESKVRTLTYEPGAMDTMMFKDALKTNDTEFRANLDRISGEDFFLSPKESASVLVKLLEEDKYENADIVHCYDVLGLNVNV